MYKLVKVELLYTATLPIAEIVFLFGAKNRKPKIFIMILGFHKRLKFKIKQGTASSHHSVQAFWH